MNGWREAGRDEGREGEELIRNRKREGGKEKGGYLPARSLQPPMTPPPPPAVRRRRPADPALHTRVHAQTPARGRTVRPPCVCAGAQAQCAYAL
jgi:hypothetical protein